MNHAGFGQIKRLLCRELDAMTPPPPPVQPARDRPTTANKMTTALLQDPNYNNNNNNNNNNTPGHDELDWYFSSRQCDSAAMNSITWWKQHETIFPSMALLARRYLSLPAASVAPERMFSTAGNMVTEKCNRLVDGAVSDLVFRNLATRCLRSAKVTRAKKIKHQHWYQLFFRTKSGRWVIFLTD